MASASEEGHGPGAGVGAGTKKGGKSKGKDESNRDRQPSIGGASTATGPDTRKDAGGNTGTLLDDGVPFQGATPPGQLPPGLNPLKYTVNDNISYENTPSNIAKAVGTGLMVGGLTAPALIGGEVTGLTDALGLGYDNPTGPVGGADYDASQIDKTTAPTSSKDTAPSIEQFKKKKNKPLAPGFTLLAGQPGTLLGS